MSLTAATLRNRHAVWALALAVAVFGTYAYLVMPMQLFPDTAPPVVNVITAYPGAVAREVSENVSRPLEEEFAALTGIVKVKSSSQDDLSLVSLEFQYDQSVDLAAVDVQNAIARIRGRLPPGIGEPQVLKFSTSDRPVISIALHGADLVAARHLAEDEIAPALQQLAGVAAIDVFGGAREAVLVELDPRRLESYGVSFTQVLDALRAHESALPAGRVRTERTRSSLRVEARARDLAELRDTAIVLPHGSQQRLSAVADVRRGALDDDARFAVDGRRGIALQVFKTDDANTVAVVHAVQEELERMRSTYPDVEMVVGEESATFTEISIDNLLSNVWQALLLASIIIFLFLGRARLSLVAVVSMPLSYAMTFAAMKLAGVQFDMVTLSAVILAVGMVVDASVVVLENITRWHRPGVRAEDAAARGVDEVRLPVLAGAASTIVVLVPLLFLSGFVGKTFGPLALTLLFAFASSVLVALVFVPVMSLYTAATDRFERAASWLSRPFRWAVERTGRGYVALLRRALRWRALTLALAAGSLALGLLALRHQGSDVLPRMDSGSFTIALETPGGSSLAETEGIVRSIERELAEEPSVVKVQSQVGFEPGMRSLSQSGAQGPTQGLLSVTLTPRTEREESIWSIEKRLRERIAHIPGIRSVMVREVGTTAKATTTAPVLVRVSGPDALVLDRLGDQVRERLAAVPSLVEPTRNWRRDQRLLRVTVDDLRGDRLGVPPAAIAAQMQAGADGAPAGDFYGSSASSIPIWVRYARADHPTPQDLLDYPVLPPDGSAPVRLRAVAELEQTTAQPLITRDQFVPTVEVAATTDGRALSFVVADVQDALATMPAPRGYRIDVLGEQTDLDDSKRSLGGALLISVLAVYLLLVAQLRSFVHPLTIMATVPLALVGVGAALWLAQRSVSMPVMVGLVLLVGTVVNSGIILLDFVRQRREAGDARRDALLEAVRTRTRPILMTALSTIVGMVPLAAEWALGAERFSPLAIAVIGGMSASTLLTLIVIPVLYDLLDDGVLRLTRRLTKDPPATPTGDTSWGARAKARA